MKHSWKKITKSATNNNQKFLFKHFIEFMIISPRYYRECYLINQVIKLSFYSQIFSLLGRKKKKQVIYFPFLPYTTKRLDILVSVSNDTQEAPTYMKTIQIKEGK